ncbi:hypothetical protein ACR3K2_27920 [Cryptosporidium serpentis]
MNEVELIAKNLQSVRLKVYNKEDFLNHGKLKFHEDELANNSRNLNIWLDYIKRVIEFLRLIIDNNSVDEEYLNKMSIYSGDFTIPTKYNVSNTTSEMSKYDIQLWYKFDAVILIIMRALNIFPSIQDIWNDYLPLLVEYEGFLIEKNIKEKELSLNIPLAYETCLIYNRKEVNIWLEYAQYSFYKRHWITKTRHIFDRSLCNVDITSHDIIWNSYLDFITAINIPIVSVNVLKRLIMFAYKNSIGLYISELLKLENYKEAMKQLLFILSIHNYINNNNSSLRGDYFDLFRISVHTSSDLSSIYKSFPSEGVTLNLKAIKIRGFEDLCFLFIQIIFKMLEIKQINTYFAKITIKQIIEILQNNTEYGRYFKVLGNNEKKESNKKDIEFEVLGKYELCAGDIWYSLCEYYMKKGDWCRVYDIYMEGIENISTIYDLSTLYDSMLMFYQCYIKTLIDRSIITSDSVSLNIEYNIYKLEKLIEQYPFTLQRVKLKNNINNIAKWIQYIDIHIDHVKDRQHPSLQVVMSFEEALLKIDHKSVKNRNMCILWIYYALYMVSLYDNMNNWVELTKEQDKEYAENLLELATEIFQRAIQDNYIKDHTIIWTEWIEMELRFKRFDKALELSRKCLEITRQQKESNTNSNLKIWQLNFDLELNFGTLETAKSTFEEIFKNGILTTGIVMSYAKYLFSNQYFEESFRIYERAIAIIPWPYIKHVWIVYLNKFVQHYTNKRIDRTRDIFESCIISLLEWRKNSKEMKKRDEYSKYETDLNDPKVLSNKSINDEILTGNECDDTTYLIFIMYAQFEEEYGRIKRMFDVYKRSSEALQYTEKLQKMIFLNWIYRACRYLGPFYARTIFEQAIQVLEKSDELLEICLNYAIFEIKAGEIDRGRHLFIYGSDFAINQGNKTSLYSDFWKEWSEFELEYGNEDTYKEMIRIKRNIFLKYSHNSIYFSYYNTDEPTKSDTISDNNAIIDQLNSNNETSEEFSHNTSDEDSYSSDNDSFSSHSSIKKVSSNNSGDDYSSNIENDNIIESEISKSPNT